MSQMDQTNQSNQQIYLSRLILNPRSREVRRDLDDHQAMHRTVLSLFPQIPPNDKEAGCTDAREYFGVLHRLDPDSRTGHITLLIQSRFEPDFSNLPDGYLSPTPPVGMRAAECKRLDDHYAHIAAGTSLAFRLRANPTRKIGTKSGPDGQRRNGKRVDLRGEEEWWAWLRRKGESAGFRLVSVRTSAADRHTPDPSQAPTALVPNVRVTADQRTYPRRKREGSQREGKRLTFASVLFEGLLEVTDPTAFRAALEQGIGSGKAYGFGLLSIAPASAAVVASITAAVPTASR